MNRRTRHSLQNDIDRLRDDRDDGPDEIVVRETIVPTGGDDAPAATDPEDVNGFRLVHEAGEWRREALAEEEL